MTQNNSKDFSEKNVQTKKGQVSNYVSKSDLSAELFPCISPKSQLNALRHFINKNKRLRDELEETSYNPYCRMLTPFQASIVKKHMFGPPFPYNIQ